MGVWVKIFGICGYPLFMNLKVASKKLDQVSLFHTANSWLDKAVNYFCNKALSWMFDRVLKTFTKFMWYAIFYATVVPKK